jgi:hypothetical protein
MDRDKRNNDDDRNAKEGFGDDQGTRVGAPDQERISPSEHSNTPPARPERTTGAGQEMQADKSNPTSQPQEHRSGYGGEGGEPVTSSHLRKPKR